LHLIVAVENQKNWGILWGEWKVMLQPWRVLLGLETDVTGILRDEKNCVVF